MRWIGLVLVIALSGGFVWLFVTADEPTADRTVPPDDGERQANGVGDPGGDEPSNDTPSHKGRVFTDSSQCAECHKDVYDEWAGSQHERAWKNPLVAQISDQFRNKICIDCHAPRPILETGLGKRVLARTTRRDDGVNCFSCHDMGGGNMAASAQGLVGPCGPTYDPRLRSADHCAVCHNQHGTVDEWRETDYATMNPPMDCITCHMPAVQRQRTDGTEYAGRSHRMLGGHDIEVIRAAAKMTTEIEDETIRVTVTNDGAGHNFPTDERHRAVDLVVRILDLDGNLVGEERRDRYRNPYRDEVGLQNTQLPWGETRRYEYPLEIPEGTVEIKLIYKFTPYVSDDEGELIFERRLSFP